MSVAMDAVGLASALGAVLFLVSLRSGAASHFVASAGVMLLAAATLHSADVLNLPNALAALGIGGMGGLLTGRKFSASMPPALLAGVAGAVGLAAVAMAVAIWLNPFAFGLIGETASHVAVQDELILCLIILTGGLASVMGGAVMFRPRGMMSALMAVSLAGWTVSGNAFLLDSVALAAAGGIAGSGALALVVRHVLDIRRKGLAHEGPHP